MFAFRDKRGAVEVAFTDAGLDLAVGVADGLETLARAIAVDAVVGMRQVHGAAVAVVADGAGHQPPEADAILTTRPKVALVARAADCVPVLLADPAAGVVAAVHAGRKGLVAGVVPAAVAALRRRGARRVTAWVGPHVCGECYEVPAAMQQEVDGEVPGTASTTSWGTPALDLGAGVRSQLAAAGAEVVSFEPCTVQDERFFSYRRQGRAAGRQAGLVWVRP